MKKVITAIIVSSAAAFAAASWIYQVDSRQDFDSDQAVAAFNSGLPVEERIAALEQAVSDERQARQWLQEEVLYLTTELELLSVGDDAVPQPDIDVEQPTEDSRAARREEARRRTPRG